MTRPDPTPGSGRAGGFTLVEVIVVIAILAILAASLAPLVAAQIDQARRDATESHLESLADALRAYQRDTNAFPPDTGDPVADLGELETDTLGKSGWSGPYIASAWSAGDYASDAWGGTIDYAYTAGAATAQLTSPGKDGTASTADDIALTVAQDYAGAEHRAEVTYERLKLVAGDVYGNNPTQAPASYTVPVAWQTDAWGNNLVYVYNNDQSAVVYSAGPDGTPGAGGPAGDDIYFARVWSPPGGGGGGGGGSGNNNALAVVGGTVQACNGNTRVAFDMTNGSAADVDVTQMAVTWNLPGSNLRRVRTEDTPGSCGWGGSSLWDPGTCGSPTSIQSSTATITAFCKAFQVTAGATYVMNEIRFDQNMSGQAITIVFTHTPVGGGTASTSTINVTVP
jgi:general secretion pathway protein G